jgi:hypothetical protein
VIKPHDSNELHNILLVITVKAKRDDNTGNIYNEVKGYSKRESLLPATPPPTEAAQGQQTQYQQAPANDRTPPWQRG